MAEARETATMNGYGRARPSRQEYERVRVAQEARPLCANCNDCKATTVRNYEQFGIVVGLCPECERKGGASMARSLARRGRESRDCLKEALEKRTVLPERQPLRQARVEAGNQ